MPSRAQYRHALAQLKRWLTPRVIGTITLAAVVFVAAGLWLLARGLPDAGAIGRMGEMDEATAVYDEHDAPAFTIYKEQRIDVPLDEMSPACSSTRFTSIEDQRFYDHRGFDLCGSSRRRSPMCAPSRLARARARSPSSSRGRVS